MKLLWIERVITFQEHLDSKRNSKIYTNKWVIKVDNEEIANDIAKKHGFKVLEPVGSLKDYFHIEHSHVIKRSRRSSDEHRNLLANHPGVTWFEQQTVKSRKKRGYFSDPLFENQWYIKNDGQTLNRCKRLKVFDKLDINVFPAWNDNVTGRGVVVSILDDGLEYTHPDLKRNYDGQASHDYNNNDHDPFPRYSADNINKHGTRCAGEVAAEVNNGICGAGVAFNARVGGIRMLDGEVTDAVEAGSLSFKPEHIDIYSSSWGPDDDGRTVDGPGPLAKKAFRDGVKNGRKGLGSIFVWATGNGGRYADYCSCDGYINSPYTISIGAVDNCGKKPWYAEECPSTLAVTYSSGEVTGKLDKQIATTDLHGGCTKQHTGTSAAAPLAAGIFALVLEANRKLTWRDLQHLIVKTSKVITKKDPNWQTNGAGHKVNPRFGFGALDTGNLVKVAKSKDWKTAQPQRVCETNLMRVNMNLKKYGSIETTLKSNGCSNLQNCVTKIEHVHLILTLVKRGDRGKLDITLTSPSGTESAILRKRARDTSSEGFKDWAFLTVFHWDENPSGTWKLKINDNTDSFGKLISWKLKFYGTCDMKSMFDIKINESEVCNDICKRGCPKIFSDACIGCSQYCDCILGRCVETCDEGLVTDSQLLHCKRSLDYIDYNLIPYSGNDSHVQTRPALGISLYAKFAIIALALVIISVMIAGVAYFAAKVPNSKNFPSGYHSVSRYPCSDGVADARDEEEIVIDTNAIKS